MHPRIVWAGENPSLWGAHTSPCASISPAPAMAPQNVEVHPLTASQLEVTWEPPPPESQNGVIQGYKVGPPTAP